MSEYLSWFTTPATSPVRVTLIDAVPLVVRRSLQLGKIMVNICNWSICSDFKFILLVWVFLTETHRHGNTAVVVMVFTITYPFWLSAITFPYEHVLRQFRDSLTSVIYRFSIKTSSDFETVNLITVPESPDLRNPKKKKEKEVRNCVKHSHVLTWASANNSSVFEQQVKEPWSL
jgi:hypothetical protein